MKYAAIALILTLFISCDSTPETPKIDTTDYTVQNEAEIVKYIADNNLNATKTASGLYYVINEPGTGAQPTASSKVTVAYKGYYTSKKVFDQSSDAGATFALQGLIKGWVEGIPFFKEGGNGILLVPSRLGYGNDTRTGIPAGSVLIFEIKLIAVK